MIEDEYHTELEGEFEDRPLCRGACSEIYNSH